jgi:hypothetical protein
MHLGPVLPYQTWQACRHQSMEISKSGLVVGEDVLILGQVDELGGLHVAMHL